MKNLVKIFATLAIVALCMVSCQKDSEVIDSKALITSPDGDKTENDKLDAVQDSIKQTKFIIEPLQEENKIENGAPLKNGLTVASYQNRVKVILTLKSIQCTSVADGRGDGQEELYGLLTSSLCESIAPNNTCQTNGIFRASSPYQRTQSRYASSALFDVDAPSYLKFATNTIVYTNSHQTYDYSYANAYYPNIKLWENLIENDGTNDAHDRYYFHSGTPTIYLAGLAFNNIHTRQFTFGDSTSRYIATVTIQKIYY
jgi:hypothetical protein